MAMVFPELFANTSRSTKLKTSFLINKYKNLIKWKNDASILEFGFGDGGNSQKSLRPLLPEDYKEFVATDVSKQMLDFARKTIEMPRCEFIELDVGCDRIPEHFKNRFDNIFSFFTNHLVENPKTMFKNVYSMLKPEGQTFQIAFVQSPLDTICHNLSKHPKWGKYKHENVVSGYFHKMEPKTSCEEDLMEAGFKNYYVTIEDLAYEFSNEEEWKGLYFAVNPIVPFIPPQELDEYKEMFLEEVRKHSITSEEDSQGRIVYKVKSPYFVICATKKD